MIPERLTEEERALLLKLAREALECGVNGQPLPALDYDSLPPRLREPGATFVTLTRGDELRGCIGTLEARTRLADDVREHAVAAALEDYRFSHVKPYELREIEIEVSFLTPMVPVEYDGVEDLLMKIRPCEDGVMIRDEWRRATFLPQVWETLPDPQDFFDHLCHKMGADPDLWRKKKLEVAVYQVEKMVE
jgi:AmmeMemoRadiSam system protein A